MADERPDPYVPVFEDRHGTHQLPPIKGGRYDEIIHGPPGTDVGDLHIELEPLVFEDEHPTTVTHSGWFVREEHAKMLEAGAHVRLSVWQHPIPPLAMSIEPPVCECHGEPMVWNDHDEGFYCAHLTTLDSTATGEPARTALDKAHQDFKPQRDDASSGEQ